MYFAFLVVLLSRKQGSHFRCVPDRVSHEVFLADLVTLLHCVHASLAQSCSCFLKHAVGAPASAPRVLLLRITRSCFVRAEPSLAGLELVSANETAAQHVWRAEGRWGRTVCFPRCAPAWRARCLPPKPYVLGLSPFSDQGCGCLWFARQSPGSPVNAQAWHFCSLLLLEFAF